MTGWGVLGATSTVARLAVLPALRASTTNRLLAAGSRSGGTVAGLEAVAYEQVLADDEVEVVYVALPNGLHHEWALACAEAGKHVLCEKPLAVASAAAQEMAEACAEAGVLLVEAYMTAFHPRVAAFERACADGCLGELRTASARFSFTHDDPSDHRWDPELGGGALADLGVYVLEGLCGAAGVAPDQVDVHAARVVPRGAVDATTVALLDLGHGLLGEAVASMELPEEQLLEVRGTAGGLRVTHAFTPGCDDRAVVRIAPDGGQQLDETDALDPYRAMVEHVGAAVRGEVALARPAERAVATVRLAARIRAAAAAST